MTLKQCVCGRSNMFPYCDGTHNIKSDDNSITVDKKNEKVV